MDYIQNLNWAIPKSFLDSMGNCRFEEGDVLFNDQIGYATWWSEAIKGLSYSIQITYPPRATMKRASIAYNERQEDSNVISIFKTNWHSDVEIDFTYYKEDRDVEKIKTTQGRLYSLLWKGDLSILNEDSPHPELPFLVDKAKDILNENINSIKQSLEDKENNIFILPFDPTNSVAMDKYNKIISIIKKEFKYIVDECSPEQLNLPNHDKFVPTFLFYLIKVKTDKIERFRDRIKKALWPTKNSKDAKITIDKEKVEKTVARYLMKTKASGGAGFSLKNHGQYVPSKTFKFGEIRTHSFAHETFYRYRLHQTKKNHLPKSALTFVEGLFEDCPNHIFEEKSLHCSKDGSKHLIADIKIKHKSLHELIDYAKQSRSFKQFKSRHENLQKFLLDNDRKTFAVEVPVWVESGEFYDFEKVFGKKLPLTGHIDILRLERDKKIGVWDYKPNAFDETYAQNQVYLYAFMLACRTGLPIQNFICGYFDEIDLYIFHPEDINEFKIKI